MAKPLADFLGLSWPRRIAVIVVYVALWILLDYFAALTTITTKPSAWYPNAGVAIGFTVYFGWPMVFLEMACRAATAGYLWDNELDPVRILIFVLVPGFFNWLIGSRLRNLISFEGRVNTAKIALYFLAFAFANAVLRSLTIQVLSTLAGIAQAEYIFSNFFLWTAGDLIGFITMAPFVISLLGPALAGAPPKRLDQKKFPFIAPVVLSLILFILVLVDILPQNHYAFWHLSIALHVFSAWTLGFHWVTFQVVLVNFLLSFVEAAHPSAVLPLEQQSFLAISAGVGLYLAGLFAEKSYHREIMERLSLDIQNAAAERTEFRNVLSHELRTPLAVILGYGDLMKKNPALFSFSKGVDKIKMSAAALSEILARLMILTNPRGAWENSKLERVDLREIVSKVSEKWAEAARKKGIALVWDAAAAPALEITVIPEGVRIMLDEVIGNAVKFTEQGFVKITAQTSGRGRVARVLVEDSGAGIDQNFPLFRTFEQETGGLSRPQGGLGIGLAICRMLLETMGGKIILQWSERGRGSIFVLEFYDLE